MTDRKPLSPRILTLFTLVAAVLASMVYAPIVWRMSTIAYDYVVHTDIAENMLTTGRLSGPHFLLQAAIILYHQLLPVSFSVACFLVVVTAVGATAAILFRMMYSATASTLAATLITTGLLLVAPLPLLAPLDGHLYFGYIGINSFHNPTMLLLKPFVLLSFILISSRRGKASEKFTLLACILTTLAATLVKPSYTIAIIPAIALGATIPDIRKQMENARIILLGVVLPALTILAWQYWITYSQQQISGIYEGKSGIIIAPFAVMSGYSSWLMAKLVLSIAFPLAILTCYYKQVRTNIPLALAWILFFSGALFTYILAESGPRFFQGNFAWSGEIALFVLFVMSAEFLFGEAQKMRMNNRLYGARHKLCVSLFVLHLLSGIVFYAAEYIKTERFW